MQKQPWTLCGTACNNIARSFFFFPEQRKFRVHFSQGSKSKTFLMIAGAKMKERQFCEMYSDTQKAIYSFNDPTKLFSDYIQQNFRVSTLNTCRIYILIFTTANRKFEIYWVWEKVRGAFYLKFILYLNNFYIQAWHHLIEQSFSLRICFTNYSTMIFNGVMSNQSQNFCLT